MWCKELKHFFANQGIKTFKLYYNEKKVIHNPFQSPENFVGQF
jgi:hypothetical protein